MFLRCLAFSRKDGSQRKYLQIVQTYGKAGASARRSSPTSGRLDELIASGTLEKLSDALSRYVENKELLCKAEELMATSALSFGPVPIFTSLWKKIGLAESDCHSDEAGNRHLRSRSGDLPDGAGTHARSFEQALHVPVGRKRSGGTTARVVELQHYYRSLESWHEASRRSRSTCNYRERICSPRRRICCSLTPPRPTSPAPGR